MEINKTAQNTQIIAQTTTPPTESQNSSNVKILSSLGMDSKTAQELGKILENTDLTSLIKEGQAFNKPLEVNYTAIVDPKGEIYARTYVESLANQYESAKKTITEYYSSAHKDNLAQGSITDAMRYISLKYTDFGRQQNSPHFRSAMSEAERQMAFRQEKALLLGGRITLKDPYALAGSGIALNKIDTIAKQTAQDKIHQLILEYKKSNGIETDTLNVLV